MTHVHCHINTFLSAILVINCKLANRLKLRGQGGGALSVVTLMKCGGFCFDEIMPGQSRKVAFQLVWPKRPDSEFRVHLSRNNGTAQSNLNPLVVRGLQ